MLRKIGLTSALALAGLCSSAMAAEHTVLMMGNGYFPDYIHPVPGDTVRFINASAVPMAATATDGSWSTGMLIVNGEYVLPVVEGMKQTYENTLPAGGTAELSIANVGVIDYLNTANTSTNATTGETFAPYGSQ